MFKFGVVWVLVYDLNERGIVKKWEMAVIVRCYLKEMLLKCRDWNFWWYV